MFRSMSINNCLFDKSRFWQGFPGENRLKSYRESRVRRTRERLPSDGFFERDASPLLSTSSTHPGVASEKALA